MLAANLRGMGAESEVRAPSSSVLLSSARRDRDDEGEREGELVLLTFGEWVG